MKPKKQLQVQMPVSDIPIEIDIQNKFINFKKAEQDLFETLNKIPDEEKMIEILGRLNKLDEGIKIKLNPTNKDIGYIG